MDGVKYSMVDEDDISPFSYKRYPFPPTVRSGSEYALDTGVPVKSFEMTYPGLLEREPIRDLSYRTPTVFVPESDEYANNSTASIPNKSNLEFENKKRKSECILSYEHYEECPVCSKYIKSKIQLFWLIIGFLLFIIICLFLLKRKSSD